jgi:hypothetical protein
MYIHRHIPCSDAIVLYRTRGMKINEWMNELNCRTSRGTPLLPQKRRLVQLELWVNAALWVVTWIVGEYCIMVREDCSDTRVGEQKMEVRILHSIRSHVLSLCQSHHKVMSGRSPTKLHTLLKFRMKHSMTSEGDTIFSH